MKKVYMQVTKDEYELHICIADRITELSKLTGKSVNSISSILSKKRKGFVRVLINDLEEEE